MKNNAYWYGYLEAGEKGSLVLRDDSLDTGKPDTFYLYNHKRDAILEYKTSFVEPKLRDLKDSEQEHISTLEKAFKASRSQFQSRTSDPLTTVTPADTSSKPKDTELKIDDVPDDDGFALDEVEDAI